MKGNKPECKVSVIMPSLNVAEYIEECLESALRQTLCGIEIICIDAGSTDGTWEIIQEISGRNSNVSCIKSKIKSYGYQVNLGIQNAHGEYIAVLETDDFADIDMYRALYEFAKKNDLDVVKANFDAFSDYISGYRHYETSDTLGGLDCYSYGTIIEGDVSADIYLRDVNIWSGIYRKDFLENNNIYLNESAGASFQDIGFVIQTLLFSKRTAYLEESYYRYRLSREASSSYSIKCISNVCREFSKLFNSENAGVAESSRGVYERLVSSLCGEFRRTAFEYGVAASRKEFDEYYPLVEKIIGRGCTYFSPIGTWDKYLELCKIVRSDECYLGQLEKETEEISRYSKLLKRDISDCCIFVFGAGRRGAGLLRWLWNEGLQVAGVCDNNSSGVECILDESVLSPAEAFEQYANRKKEKRSLFLIPNKNDFDTMKLQLVERGVQDEDIYEVRVEKLRIR